MIRILNQRHVRLQAILSTLVMATLLSSCASGQAAGNAQDAGGDSASSPSAEAGDRQSEANNDWLVAVNEGNSTRYTLFSWDPAEGTWKGLAELGDVNADEVAAADNRVSGDYEYAIFSDDPTTGVPIDILDLVAGKGIEPVDPSLIPDFKPDTEILSVTFKPDAPHTLLVATFNSGSTTVDTWGFDVTSPGEVPKVVATSQPWVGFGSTRGDLRTDPMTGRPYWYIGTSQGVPDGEEVSEDVVVTDVIQDKARPWGAILGHDDYDGAFIVEDNDGTQWKIRDPEDQTMYVMELEDAAHKWTEDDEPEVWTSAGKLAAGVPGDQILWIRPPFNTDFE